MEKAEPITSKTELATKKKKPTQKFDIDIQKNKYRRRARNERTFTFSYDEASSIKQSLELKGDYGTWLRGEGGEGKNRYQRLRDSIDNQLLDRHDDAEMDREDSFKVIMGLRDRRRLRSALRFIQKHQEYILKKETIHENKNFRKHEDLSLDDLEVIVIEVCEKKRLAALAIKATLLLEKLGYMNPENNLKLFGLKLITCQQPTSQAGNRHY